MSLSYVYGVWVESAVRSGGVGAALLEAWVAVDQEQMSKSALNCNDSLTSHKLPRPTSECAPEHICLWLPLCLQLSACFCVYTCTLLYLLGCCFVSRFLISRVTSASQLCPRLSETQGSVLTVSCSDSFVFSSYQMMGKCQVADWSFPPTVIILRSGSCGVSASFWN